MKRPNTSIRSLTAVLLLAGVVGTSAEVHYVDVNATNPTPPYTNWATAATNIQDAVDAAVAGDEIVVTNGIYTTGGRATAGDTTLNRVVVDKPLSLRSINGPQSTTIDGGGLVRCVYLTNQASLSGFTLTNGFTASRSGAGVHCESQSAVVSNCVVSGNVALVESLSPASGGGASGGTLNNCTLTGNSGHSGGGALLCTLNDCTLSGNSAGSGGGAASCTLNNCILIGNEAHPDADFTSGHYFGGGYGGGADYSTLNNCTLTGNSAFRGGGADGCILNNCTLTGNSASRGSLDASNRGGGAIGSILKNCIVCFNLADSATSSNYDTSSTLSYCCTMPLPTNGVGNITSDPLFMDKNGWANLRLQSISPCINAGNNAYAVSDTALDGNSRIVDGAVDLGAFEFQSLPSIAPQLTIAQSGTNLVLSWLTNYAEVVIQQDHYEAYLLYFTTNLVSPVVWHFVYPTPVVANGQLVVTNSLDGPQRFYRLMRITGPLGDVPCLWNGPNPCPCAYDCVSGVWSRHTTCRTCDGF